MTIDSWLAAADGDPSGLWLLSLMGDLAFPGAEVWGDAAAVGRADAAVVKRYFAAGGDKGSVLGNPGSEFLFASGGLLSAWPANADDDSYSRIQDSPIQTLVISGAHDLATPAENARGLMAHLPNGHQVVLPGFGHTTDFWDSQPAAGSHLVTAFLDTGRVDDSRFVDRPVDFSPGLTHTALAKGLAAGMVGFALVTVFSLLWMAGRVRRRGRFGRKASAALRSAHVIVLGLGGWCIAALTVMTTSAAVALDGRPLVGLSVAVPIALGIYLAWVDPDLPARTRATGFCATIGGALLGAVLGASVALGLLALVTAIVGAAAGANLALIAYDVVSASTGRREIAPVPPATATAPAPRARVTA
jgi:hypothetical protein